MSPGEQRPTGEEPDVRRAIIGMEPDALSVRAIANARLSSLGLDAAGIKAVATAQARAALRGFELERLADGSFIAQRWGLFKTMADMAEVEGWLFRLEAMPKDRAR